MALTRTIPTLDNPELLDNVLVPFAAYLQTNLSWLSNAYGKAERWKDNEGKIFPHVYAGGTEYVDLGNDEHLNNHSFFFTNGVTKVEGNQVQNRIFTDNMNIVFFWDYREVFADQDVNSIENVKAQILAVLNGYKSPYYGFGITAIHEVQVFRGFNIDDPVRPYGAIRFEGDFWYYGTCP